VAVFIKLTCLDGPQAPLLFGKIGWQRYEKETQGKVFLTDKKLSSNGFTIFFHEAKKRLHPNF
jgi:hypothetical protein